MYVNTVAFSGFFFWGGGYTNCGREGDISHISTPVRTPMCTLLNHSIIPITTLGYIHALKFNCLLLYYNNILLYGYFFLLHRIRIKN